MIKKKSGFYFISYFKEANVHSLGSMYCEALESPEFVKKYNKNLNLEKKFQC